MKYIIEFLKKPLCIDEGKYNLTKSQCVESIIFLVFHFLMTCILITFLKMTFFYEEALEFGYFTPITKLKWGAVIFFPSIISILIFMKLTNQKLITIGIKKQRIFSSLLISVPLIIIVYSKYIFTETPINIVIYSVYYLIFVGFEEEILFRGFIWIRIQKLFGRKIGIIITGIIFCIYHAPFQVIWFDKPISSIFFSGSITILGGIAVHIIFGYIYSRNENIILPSLIHGLLDLYGN